ncbi:MAG TPA: hypothetical protein VF600_09315 [Abditibacteriaceae bacterium]|jgi:hypothetical protein
MSKKWALWVSWAAVVIVMCGIGIVAYFFYAMHSLSQTTVISHIKDWDRFYAETVTAYGLHVPHEARIIEATEEKQFMGQKILVRFTLPNTKHPKQWTQLIAQKSGMTGLKKTDFQYESYRTENGGNADNRILRYFPREDMYEMRFEWG